MLETRGLPSPRRHQQVMLVVDNQPALEKRVWRAVARRDANVLNPASSDRLPVRNDGQYFQSAPGQTHRPRIAQARTRSVADPDRDAMQPVLKQTRLAQALQPQQRVLDAIIR